MMNKVYTFDKLPGDYSGHGSIFLAGGTLRITGEKDSEAFTKSWRRYAELHFETLGFEGNLVIPEWKDGIRPIGWTYEKQILWENEMLETVDKILFWIPRSEEYPCLTTNIEFGEWQHSEKIVVGSPSYATKMEYIKTKCRLNGIPYETDLYRTCEQIINLDLGWGR